MSVIRGSLTTDCALSQNVQPMLQSLSPSAQAIGAVNTIIPQAVCCGLPFGCKDGAWERVACCQALDHNAWDGGPADGYGAPAL